MFRLFVVLGNENVRLHRFSVCHYFTRIFEYGWQQNNSSF